MGQQERVLDVGGEEIAAVFHRPEEDADHVVVFCHGFGSDKEGSYRRRARMVADAGMMAVRFDFRGNNESSRSFDEADLTTRIEDLERVLDELEGRSVGVYGSSFGGLVAIQTAARDDRIDGLALRAPVTYMSVLDDIRGTIAEEGRYEQLPGKWVDERFLEDVTAYSTEDVLDRIVVPTLVMHGEKDEVVPMESSRRFFDALSCEKRYMAFEGEGHRFSDGADDEAVMAAVSWFRDRLG